MGFLHAPYRLLSPLQYYIKQMYDVLGKTHTKKKKLKLSAIVLLHYDLFNIIQPINNHYFGIIITNVCSRPCEMKMKNAEIKFKCEQKRAITKINWKVWSWRDGEKDGFKKQNLSKPHYQLLANAQKNKLHPCTSISKMDNIKRKHELQRK